MAPILAELLGDGQKSGRTTRIRFERREGTTAGEKERKGCVAGSLPPLDRKPAMTSSEAFQRGHRGPIANFQFSSKSYNTEPDTVCSKLYMGQNKGPKGQAPQGRRGKV